MTFNRRDYINQALRILDLPAGTHAAETNAFDGNPANQVYTSDQSLTDFCNDGACELAQSVLPLWDTGTVSGFTTGYAAFQSLTVSSGNRLWAVEGEGVRLGSARVVRGGRHWIAANSAAGTVGNPFLYWHPLGQGGINVVGVPTPSSGTLSVYGLAVPKFLSGDSDTFPAAWLDPEDSYTLALYMAARVAEKRASDAILGVRAPELWAQYDARRKGHWDQLTGNERSLLPAFGDGAAAVSP